MIDFVNAMKRGLGRDGSHLYPAFPYTSYQRMTYEDLIDLKTFLDTLPPVVAANRPHDIAFPYSLRRVLGLWKLAFLDGGRFAPDPALGDAVNRGAALVEGPGHCNQCHTPRRLFGALGLGFLDDLTSLGYLGGLDYARALGGAPSLSGSSKPAPNITPGKGGIGGQSADDLLIAFLTGGGNMGGDMADVQRNLAMVNQLAPDDLKAIVAYLRQVKPWTARRPRANRPAPFPIPPWRARWGGDRGGCVHE